MNFRSTFAGFAMLVLGMNLYDWQQDVLWLLDGRDDEPTRVALRTCNESGKTSQVATAAVLANAALNPESLTVTMAGVYRQVKHQLWPNIKAHASRFEGWEVNETDLITPNGSRAVGFSTDDPEKFEGWHNKDLLIIVDEAKSVPQSIFGAIRRCAPKRLLVMSSPGAPRGELYDAYGTKKTLYRSLVVTAFDCPHWGDRRIVNNIMEGCPQLDRQTVTVMVEQRDVAGLLNIVNDPLTLSMVFAEFMSNGGGDEYYPFSDTMLRLARENPPAKRTGAKVAFLDFAAGGDENVFAVRDGNVVLPLECWRERDTMRACGEFIMKFRRHGLKAEQIFADGDGLGIPMLDRLAELGWRVHRCHNNATASNPDKYKNRIAEMYWEAAKKIQAKEVILPADDVLDAQLIGRQSFPSSDGRLQLEAKQDMRKNGMSSPDRADALVGVLTCFNPLTPKNVISGGMSPSAVTAGGEEIFEGADAGI
ncbi:MAG: hypothetical protein LBK60_06400 [Verrucomicrobiales bacterium]|nr:hypothetical protein [Verrucomicrobiales bacterium]